MKQNKENLLEQRRLTISELRVPLRYQQSTHCPMIRISGKWLEKCGFGVGDKISLDVYQEKMVVTILRKSERIKHRQ